jgi:hypothetical protein
MRSLLVLLASVSTVACTVGAAPPPPATCKPIAIDSDGDGVSDGLDTDCDGDIDVPIQHDGDGSGAMPDAGTPPTGEPSQCQSLADNLAIQCQSDGGPSTCDCRDNGTLVKTCTTTSTSPCELGGDNCCGF